MSKSFKFQLTLTHFSLLKYFSNYIVDIAKRISQEKRTHEFDYRRTLDLSNVFNAEPNHAIWIDGEMFYASQRALVDDTNVFKATINGYRLDFSQLSRNQQKNMFTDKRRREREHMERKFEREVEQMKKSYAKKKKTKAFLAGSDINNEDNDNENSMTGEEEEVGQITNSEDYDSLSDSDSDSDDNDRSSGNERDPKRSE